VVRADFQEAQADLISELVARRGSPPITRRIPSHLQLDQLPPVELASELTKSSLALPFVQSRQSRMASPQTLALYVPDICAAGPPDAFIDGHEFCHVHPLPEFTVHLTLPNEFRQLVVGLGWAEQHPMACLGSVPQSLVLVYAPRDRTELNVVVGLVQCSYEFARGLRIEWAG